MSRSGYSDDCEDQWALIRYRGAVKSAFRGKRGKAFLCEAAEAMDAMPVKELAAGALRTEAGAFCTLGVVGAARGVDLGGLDPEDIEVVAATFGISDAMAREIVFWNDEGSWSDETPEARWVRMRLWLKTWLERPLHGETLEAADAAS